LFCIWLAIVCSPFFKPAGTQHEGCNPVQVDAGLTIPYAELFAGMARGGEGRRAIGGVTSAS
jgi:hypothetical protein